MKLTKSAALKASLLMVLAANVSWEHVNFGSANLASEGVVSGGGSTTSAPAATGDGKVSSAPEAVTVKAKGDVPAPVVAKAAPVVIEASTEQPQAKKYSDQEPYHADLRLCGDLYKVTYKQVERAGKPATEVSAAKGSSDQWDITLTFNTSLINTVAERKDSTNKTLANALSEARRAKGEACPAEAPAEKTVTTAVSETVEKTVDDKTTLEENKKTLAEDIKNCKVDRDGKSLEKGERMDCLVTALEYADKRIPKKGPNGKLLSESTYSKLVLAEVQNLQKMLKPILKSEMLTGTKKKTKRSRDGEDEIDDRDLTDRSERAEAAQEAALRAADAIEEMADAYDLGKSSSRSSRSTSTVSKMVNELKALASASKVREKAELYAEEAEHMSNQLIGATQDVRASAVQMARRPGDYLAMLNNQRAESDLVLIENSYRQFDVEVKSNLDSKLQQLKQYQRANLISAQDFKAFSQPIVDTTQLMNRTTNTGFAQGFGRNANAMSPALGLDRINGSMLEDYDVPSNLSAMRATVNQGAIATSGIPSRAPVLNLPSVPRAF